MTRRKPDFTTLSFDFNLTPLKHAEKLTDSQLGSYRFRVGDYRIIFDLVESEIVVLRIGHRREIYRT